MGPKPKGTRQRLEEAQQGRRAAMRDSCVALPQCQFSGHGWVALQGVGKKKGGRVCWF